jgi:apoptosis-stimulating of p53 protein 1
MLFQLAVGGGGAVLVLSELESMATRQQREIVQQRRLLEQKEARLAVLRGAQVRPVFPPERNPAAF